MNSCFQGFRTHPGWLHYSDPLLKLGLPEHRLAHTGARLQPPTAVQTQTRQQSFLPSFPQITAQCKREAACRAELLQNAPTPQKQRWVPPPDSKDSNHTDGQREKEENQWPVGEAKEKAGSTWRNENQLRRDRQTCNHQRGKHHGKSVRHPPPALCTELEPYWGLSWKSLSCDKRTTFHSWTSISTPRTCNTPIWEGLLPAHSKPLCDHTTGKPPLLLPALPVCCK